MCITCNVKVKGLHWLKVALYFVKEQMIVCLHLFCCSCITEDKSVLWLNSLRRFQMDKYENLSSNLWIISCLFSLISFFFFFLLLALDCTILNEDTIAPQVLGEQASLSQPMSWIHQFSTKAVSPLNQAGLSVSVSLSCGRPGGNFKVLWKTKSGPAAAASCWPTLFRGSRYRLMTGLLLSGPHY